MLTYTAMLYECAKCLPNGFLLYITCGPKTLFLLLQRREDMVLSFKKLSNRNGYIKLKHFLIFNKEKEQGMRRGKDVRSLNPKLHDLIEPCRKDETMI